MTCSGCGAATTVPFTPTPGRPVYCRDCFARKNAASPPAGGAGARPPMGARRDYTAEAPVRTAATSRKRMLSQGRKAHFVYDTMEVLTVNGGTLGEDQRRAFVEMLFTRGARLSSQAAYEFLVEKRADNTITKTEADKLTRLLEQYSFWR